MPERRSIAADCSPPDFFQLIKQTMRDEILAFCEEGGFVPHGSSVLSSPSKDKPKGSSSSKNEHEDDTQDDPLSDREEGEFVSDEDEGEIEVPAPSLRLFKAEEYLYLLFKNILALELQFSQDDQSSEKE